MNLLTVLAEASEVVANINLKGIACIAAAISILGGMACAIGEGNICTKAVEGIARNPEADGKIRSAMIIGCAITESTAIYSLLISLLIIFFVVL